MLRLYMDMCCYNRPYDDQSQVAVHLEAQAVTAIQRCILKGAYELVWSFILTRENNGSPFVSRRETIGAWKWIAAETVTESDEVHKLAQEIMACGIKQKDAMHVASSIESKCDYFLTTDKRVLNKQVSGIRIINPLGFIGIYGGDSHDE